MGFTNTTTRVPSYHNPARVRDISSPSDFPAATLAPDGEMRRLLVANTLYRIHENFELPLFWVPKVVAPPIFEIIVFEGVSPPTLTCPSITPYFWGRDIGSMQFIKVSLVDLSNGGIGGTATLFDLVGGNGPQSVIGFSQVALSNVKSLGNLVDVGLTMNSQTNSIGVRRGWVLRSNPGPLAPHVFSNRSFAGLPYLPDNPTAAISVLGTADAVSITGNGVSLAKTGNAFLFIDPNTSIGAYSITSQNYGGLADGAFFRPDVSISITMQADASVSILSFADSAANPGVDTTVSFAAIVDIVRGQAVLIDGGTYAGAYAVVRVADDQTSFDITIAFAGASAGTLALTEHTVAVTQFVRDETVTISGTTNYNGTVSITLVSDTTFITPQVFAGDDATGIASSSGRDQTSVGVKAFANGSQEDSAVLGEAFWNGNASSTSITDVTYVPLVLTGVTLADGAERIVLADAASGRMRYDGEAPIRVSVVFSLQAQKGGASAASYRIALSKNGVVPVFASERYAPLELRDVNKQVLYQPTVRLEPGDEVQPMIAGNGFTAAVTFTDGQILLNV